jgi:hypothetical protein
MQCLTAILGSSMIYLPLPNTDGIWDIYSDIDCFLSTMNAIQRTAGALSRYFLPHITLRSGKIVPVSTHLFSFSSTLNILDLSMVRHSDPHLCIEDLYNFDFRSLELSSRDEFPFIYSI